MQVGILASQRVASFLSFGKHHARQPASPSLCLSHSRVSHALSLSFTREREAIAVTLGDRENKRCDESHQEACYASRAATQQRGALVEHAIGNELARCCRPRCVGTRSISRPRRLTAFAHQGGAPALLSDARRGMRNQIMERALAGGVTRSDRVGRQGWHMSTHGVWTGLAHERVCSVAMAGSGKKEVATLTRELALRPRAVHQNCLRTRSVSARGGT